MVTPLADSTPTGDGGPSPAAKEGKESLSPVKQALLEVRRMRAKLEEVERAKTEPIAVIGLGLRYPGGASTPQAFWQLLRDGVDAIIDIPPSRWDVEAFYDPDPDANEKMYVRQGGFLREDIAQFDPTFFAISPREAQNLDPQQRLLLEVSWEALENAGLAPDKLDGSQTGVFVGIGGSQDYALSFAAAGSRIDAYVGPGATYSAAAGRLSYFYGFKGPAMSVDTACSSSLVATHLACQALRHQECNMTLVAGVTLHLEPHSFINQCKLRMTSPDGRCKAFDSTGNGVGRGEGCGVIILKRLSDAIAAGDNILAVIRGSAINQDGRTSGLTAPNGPSQQTVIRKALASAGVEPAQVTYLEAHGTGTPLGDPIEVQAAAAVFGRGRPADKPLLMGSVKTNIGHLEEGAGVASLIKVILSLQHQEIPPSLHFDEPNPYIAWDQLPVKVNTERTLWPRGETPRLAGISSFGWSGTNVHIIMEEPPLPEVAPVVGDRPQHLLTLSARGETALAELAQRYETYFSQIEDNDQPSFADICFTANTGRANFTHRLAIAAESTAAAREKLAAFAAGQNQPGLVSGKVRGTEAPEVAFLFTGQGSQYIGMGRQLYETEPVFRATLDKCDELLRPYMDQPLLSLIYPADDQSPIDETAYTQPALFALEYALATLWRSWGIEPAVVMGHSVGEYVAACVAGVFSLEDGLRLIAERGRLMQTLPKDGQMAAVFTNEKRVEAALAPYKGEVSIAAINGPEIIVISGAKGPIEAITEQLKRESIRAWPLAVSHALHTDSMEPILEAFEELASTVTFAPPKIKMISMLTGQPVDGPEIANATYWRRHMREAVRFADAMTSMHQLGYELYLEVGPNPSLLSMGQLCLPEGVGVWLPSLRQNRDEWHQMLESLGALYVQGVEIAWADIDREYAASRRRAWLPNYPFQHQRYWHEIVDGDLAGSRLGLARPLTLKSEPRFNDWLYEVEWQPTPRLTSTEAEPGDRPTQPNHSGTWLIFADPHGVGAATADRLKNQGEPCILVYPGSTFEMTTPGQWQIDPTRPEDFERLFEEAIGHLAQPLQGIIHLWSLGQEMDAEALSADQLQAIQALNSGSVLFIVQTLLRTDPPVGSPQLWLVTRGAQPVGETGLVAVQQAPLWGLGHVIGLEHPELRCVRVDLDPQADVVTNSQTFFEELWSPDAEDRVAFRAGSRYGARLVRSAVLQQANNGQDSSVQVQAEASYLITGGLGGLGLVTARWLVDQGAKHLVLMGRSAPSENTQAVIDELRQAGVQVVIGQADVTQIDQLSQLFAQIDESLPPLRGIVHAAGVLDDGVLLQQEWDRFSRVIAPKIDGTWNLHRLSLDRPLDFFLLFSSSVSVLGSPGQGNYAVANSFLDALAHYRRAQGLPALSINWGGWSEIGMAAALNRQNNQRWAAMGVSLITPDDGLRVLAQLLPQSIPQIGVFPINWSRFGQQFAAGQVPPLLAAMVQTVPMQEQPGQAMLASSELMQQLEAAPLSKRRDLLLAHIRSQAVKVLGLDQAYALDSDQPLRELGLDSLMAVQLRNALGLTLGRTLPATLLFNYPTISELTDYLLKQGLVGMTSEGQSAGRSLSTVSGKEEPIAIVGMSCRFPGANSLQEFWQLLRDGVDAITEVPAERWDIAAYYDPEPGLPGKMYTRWGGFLTNVDQFDPQFFGISPREAISMDPQQRLLLEVSWEALEHAGHAPASLNGSRTGVFVGIGNYDYAQLQVKLADPARVSSYSGSGSSLSVAAGRLSYILGLQGPSMAVDTACSSSLVALHLACQSLRAGECDEALAGGVNLILSPEATLSLSQARMMAADGRCKTFDAAADGFVRSEGCGVVVLKRLSEAVADGDNVLAVIRGTAINQDGRSQGLTAPNGLAQEAVIRQALANAGVEAKQVSYIEAHGTGTPLGDPIEVGALGSVYGAERNDQEKLVVGSVKTNVGHMETAAGVGGLIKVVLAMQNEMIPPHLYSQQPNPYIPWDELPIEIATGRAWPTGNDRRIAGLSSFGFSGTNVHAIIEEAPVQQPEGVPVDRPSHILALSAKSEAALQELAGQYAHVLAAEAPPLADLCYTANTGRSHFAHRLAIIADEAAVLPEKLAAFVEGQKVDGLMTRQSSSVDKPKIAFLFTGQGAQYVGMGRQLYETQPTFRAALDRCADILRPYLDQPLLSVLYPADGASSPIDETAYTQPALFALEYALATLWQSWGIEPAAVMGHSVGEYVAACIAGVFSLEDGLKLIAERGRLMQALPQDGAMAAVFAPEAQVQMAIERYRENAPVEGQQVSLAAVNGADHIVISGLAAAVQVIVETLEQAGIKTRRLNVSHAFHSPLMEPMLAAFETFAASVDYSTSKIALISNVTGQTLSDAPDALYWRRHVREAVRFADGMTALHQQGYELFVEIGPNPTLLGMGRRCLPPETGVWLPSLRQNHAEWPQMLESLSALYGQGIEVDWVGFDQDYAPARRRLALPTYPFQRQRYWYEMAEAPQSTGSPSDEWLYEVNWEPQPLAVETGSTFAQPGSWLILADGGGVGAALARQLQAQGEQCLIARPQMANQSRLGGQLSTPFGGPSDGVTADRWLNPADPAEFQGVLREMMGQPAYPLRGIIHLWALDAPDPQDAGIAALDTAQLLGSGSSLHLIQALATVAADLKSEAAPHLAAGNESPRLWLVTRAAQPVEAGPQVTHLAQSPLWGLGKTIALEQPRLWGGLIDLDPAAPAEEAGDVLAEIWQSEGEQQVAFRQGQRYVARLGSGRDKLAPTSSFHFRPDGAYLISGGLGGLGLQVAEWFVNQGARRLILLGRTPLPPRTMWKHIDAGSPQAAQITAIRQLETLGASVHIAAVDVANEAQLAAFLSTYEQEGWPPIRGVVHAAGLVRDKSLLQLDLTALNEVLRPKVMGGWLLHHYLKDAPLDFFVMFSSAASLLGSAGQGNYAAANAFLEGLAHYRHSQGQPALSINWGPWAEVGMAARTDVEGRMARLGMGSIAPDQGLEWLGRLLGQDITQMGVVPITPAQLSQLSRLAGPFLAQINPETLGAADMPAEGSVSERIRQAPDQERLGLMEAHLQRRIAQALLMETATIPMEHNLMELGLDSIMIMDLIQQLDRDLNLSLFPREIFERPSVSALADYLLKEVERVQQAAMGVEPAPVKETESVSLRRASARPVEAQSLERNPGIVLLLSSPRSGSTLLRVMLAGHPALFSPPELHLLPFNSMAEYQTELGHSYLSGGLLRAIKELMALDDDQSRQMLADWIEQDLSVQQAYGRLQALANPRLLVDKSPSYTLDINIMERAEIFFEKPKYIHLVRHPYAVIDSIVRSRLDKLYKTNETDPMKFAEQLWASTNSNVLDFLETIDPERHHFVSYEALVTDPEQVMRALCAFLDIAFDPLVLTPYDGARMKDQSVAVGDPDFFKYQGIDPAKATTWQSINLPRRLGGFARRIAAEFNYELPWSADNSGAALGESARVAQDSQRQPLKVETETQPKPAVVNLPPITPVARDDELPLSFAQQRLLFIDLLEPGRATYNVPIAIRLTGSLNLAALGDSLTEIMQRHEVLRTTFVMKNGMGSLEIIPKAVLPWQVVDLETVSPTDRPAELRQLIKAEIQQPFDLAHDVKMRAKLYRLGPAEHVLVVTMHHIASDGWSVTVLLRELAELYEALAAGRPSSLPALPIQYADYAHWLRQWLQGEALERSLVYWKQQLKNTAILELPTDRPRPPVQTYRGDRFPFTLSSELTASLKALSRREGVTLFMTLLAAFQALLYRYTGQEDCAVGSPIAGRNQPETKDLIGFFVNTLVLRTNLAGNPTFHELLQRVRRVALEAYEYQDLPFDKLVEEVQPARNLSHSPLFQVMFALQNMPLPGMELSDLTMTRLTDITTNTAMFDLFLPMMDTPEGLVGLLEYNTDLFDQTTISRMVGNLETLLAAVVNDSSQPITNLPILTQAERQQLLIEWNDTKLDYPQEACLHQLFEAQVEQTPNITAIVFEGQQLTYRELNERANQLAHYLQNLGVGTETLVGIYVERSIDMVVGLLGVLKAGGAYVPLDPAFPADRLAFMVADSEAKVLLTQQLLKDLLPVTDDVKTVCLDTDWELIAQESSDNLPAQSQAHNLAYVIYTSGSTGKPKGVQLEHQGVVNFLTTMRQEPGLAPDDVLLSVTTLSFDISVLEVFLPLTTGAQLVVVSRATAADGKRLAAELEQSGTTVMQATPATWRLLIESGWSGLASLKILCGGEALPRDLANQLLDRCAALWNVYGPTETTIWSTTIQVQPGENAISIGRPIGNTQCYVLDAELQPAPIGVPGELHIGGDGLARGYLKRPELTNEKFIADPFRDKPGARLYKTGDLVHYRPDGTIEFLGRIDHQVKIRGFRIELGEIESVLTQHPAVHMAVVTDREDVPGDRRLVGYIIPNNGDEPKVSELRRFLGETLPAYMVPSNFVIMEAFPLTPNGKVNRRALPAPEVGRPELGVTYVAPETEIEQTIADLWKEALKVENVGIHDNFFDLGGHSLLLAQVHGKLQQQLGFDLPIVRLFQYPTISTLAKFLSQERSNGEEARKASQQQIQQKAHQQRAALARQRQRAMKVKGSTND
ncbi:MAG: amino acid adenylation domain-containing protein [Anaerolineales bacterium]|nr:amino acid adenylation domain-containing protein [Anaerolineales bacterium]